MPQPILFRLQGRFRAKAFAPLVPLAEVAAEFYSPQPLGAAAAITLGSSDTLAVVRGSAATDAWAMGRAAAIGALRGTVASVASAFGRSSTIGLIKGIAASAAGRFSQASTLATLRGAVSAAAARFSQLSTLGARRGAAAAGLAVRVAIAAAIGRGCGMSTGGGFVVASMVEIGRRRGLAVTSPLLFTANLGASASPSSSRTEMAVRVHRDGHPALRSRGATAIADDRDGALSRALRTTAVSRSRR